VLDTLIDCVYECSVREATKKVYFTRRRTQTGRHFE